MSRRLLAFVVVMAATVAVGCQSPEATKSTDGAAKPEGAEQANPEGEAKPATEAASAPAKPIEAGSTGHFGAPFTVDASQPLASVLDEAEKHDGKTVRVKGEVASVCKKKGCWFVVKTDEATERTVRITMKDYGFFVPKDCDGKVAEIEGVLERKVIKEAERKHLAEDGGEDASKVTGDAEEIRLVATGVEIQG